MPPSFFAKTLDKIGVGELMSVRPECRTGESGAHGRFCRVPDDGTRGTIWMKQGGSDLIGYRVWPASIMSWADEAFFGLVSRKWQIRIVVRGMISFFWI